MTITGPEPLVTRCDAITHEITTARRNNAEEIEYRKYIYDHVVKVKLNNLNHSSPS